MHRAGGTNSSRRRRGGPQEPGRRQSPRAGDPPDEHPSPSSPQHHGCQHQPHGARVLGGQDDVARPETAAAHRRMRRCRRRASGGQEAVGVHSPGASRRSRRLALVGHLKCHLWRRDGWRDGWIRRRPRVVYHEFFWTQPDGRPTFIQPASERASASGELSNLGLQANLSLPYPAACRVRYVCMQCLPACHPMARIKASNCQVFYKWGRTGQANVRCLQVCPPVGGGASSPYS